MGTEFVNIVHVVTLHAEWMLTVICRHRNILYTEIIELQRKGWPESWDFYSSGIWTEGRNRQEESPDTAASAETWTRQARPWGLRNWASLCGPVRSCVEWSVKGWDVESQLCPLSWDCSEAQRNPSSRPSRQHERFTARTGSSHRRKTPLWPMNNYWSNRVGTVSLVFHRQGHITSVPLVLHHFSNCCHSLMQISSWITNTDLIVVCHEMLK